MTEDEMFNILGYKGEILSEVQNEVTKTVMYQYYGIGSFGANANFTVQDGKVVSKAQFGLQ